MVIIYDIYKGKQVEVQAMFDERSIPGNERISETEIAYLENIMPVEEMMPEEEFTDRVEILRELDEWVKNIGRMASGSTAIIAPRRLGKTSVLDRLVNTVFFKPEYKVAPFYFKMKREETTLRKFLLEYATTFFRQYIAYCMQDPALFRRTRISLEQLTEIKSEHNAVLLAQEFIRDFIRRYYGNDHEDARNHWDAFIKEPENLAAYSGTRVAVIIDEFQDMKLYIFDVSEDYLEKLKNEKKIALGYGGVDLTATYDRQSQSRKAPMLVSGSAVTMVFRTVMGGPLGGRFGFKYLKPMSIPDGATLLKNLLKIYMNNTEITTENALYASTQVGGHPYYLYCLAVSEYESKSFEDKEAINKVIRYETENGKIYGFWQTHFDRNRELINNDNNVELGKKIIYYFTKYNNESVDIKEIAGKLKVSKEEVEKKIEKLHLADLVYRTAARYYTFNDICLMRFIKFVYEKDLEGVEKIDLSQDKLFNNLKGMFLEVAVQVTMMKFGRERLKGEYFGKKGEVEVPLFQVVKTKYIKGENTRAYQIDVYGKEWARERVWLCECKYTRDRMGMNQVRKIEAAAKALKEEAAEEGRTVPEIRIWVVSTGGFTDEVIAYVRDREDMYSSDYEGINGLFRAYGGGYDIPVFQG